MGRHKRPSMIQVTRKVHKNALDKIDQFIELQNTKELKKESKNEAKQKYSNGLGTRNLQNAKRNFF